MQAIQSSNSYMAACERNTESTAPSHDKFYLHAAVFPFFTYLLGEIVKRATAYHKTDETRRFQPRSIVAYALGAACATARLWFIREKDIYCLVGLWQTGQWRIWSWLYYLQDPISYAFLPVLVGFVLPHILGAVLLWRSRGGTLTWELTVAATSIVVFSLLFSVSVLIIPRAVLETIALPIELLLGKRKSRPEAMKTLGTLALAIVSGAGAWALYCKQKGVATSDIPFWRFVAGLEDKADKDAVQPVKTSSSPDDGAAKA